MIYSTRFYLPASTLHRVMITTDYEFGSDRQVLLVSADEPSAVKEWLRSMRDEINTTLKNIEQAEQEARDAAED